MANIEDHPGPNGVAEQANLPSQSPAPLVPPELAQTNDASHGAPSSRRPRPNQKHFFGLPQNYHHAQQNMSDDYEQRFPEDPRFEEAGENARVWRTYLAESAAFDENMLGEARDGLDVMLVFAGLFSAVVTSFLVQTSQNLQLNSSDVSASLLAELIAVQRAAASGLNITLVPVATLTPTTKYVPTALDVWVNGLWAVSLTFALVVALAAVLIKQWLRHYAAIPSGTPKGRSHIHQFKYAGFEKRQVQNIIGTLPSMMHISLGLFLTGLTVFLVPLQLTLACIIGTITFIAYTLYLVSKVIPIFIPQCPYQTPCSNVLQVFLIYFAHCMLCVWLRLMSGRQQPVYGSSPKDYQEGRERIAVSSNYNALSVEAIEWLFATSFNLSVHSVAFQAISGLPMDIRWKVAKIGGELVIQDLYQDIFDCTTVKADFEVRVIIPGSETLLERAGRAILLFPPSSITYSPYSSLDSASPKMHDPFLETVTSSA
ncbi:hypothetical protein GYMLUDRAFT_39613 [Collybiopsis luxurians FD-317 M1]|nr:hypothetical protein GYMLUDRAFT_39613 [Collybiopsis luxurians FD-317 M1]